MNALKFTLTLIEPVLVMAPGAGDPNSADSLDYLPGSSLLGALATRFLAGRQVDALDAEFRSLFLSGEVKFLNAYPLSPYGERMLPTPISWKQSSDLGEDTAYDWVTYLPQTPAEKQAKWSEVAGKNPFCVLYEQDKDSSEGEQDQKFSNVEFWNAAENSELSIHTFRQDRQNVTGEGSTVFRYKSLAAGNRLMGVILSDDAKKLEILQKFLEGQTLHVGRSSQAGYGLVEISNTGLEPGWQEFTPVEDDRLVVTLLSHALVRHPVTGAWVVDLAPLAGLQPEMAFVRPVVTGSFNRTWGLPLPQSLAICAGSVFVFPASPGLKEKIEGWVQTGLGERTHEGFGRVALNWNTKTELWKMTLPKKEAPLPVKLTDESARLARQMSLRMLRRTLELKLTAAVNGTRIFSQPQNAQLSRLRTAIRAAMQQESTEPVEKFIHSLKKTALGQYKNAHVAGIEMDIWVSDVVKDPYKTLKIELKVAKTDVKTIGGVVIQLESPQNKLPGVDPDIQKLALEYTLRYLDGVLKQALKNGGKA